MFFAQTVKLRGLPFRTGEFPALEEYGVTLSQATTAEDAALAEIAVSRKAGKLADFSVHLRRPFGPPQLRRRGP